MGPGWTELTRTLSRAAVHSSATDLLRIWIAPLVAEYAARPRPPRSPTTDDRLMMLPPPDLRISGRLCLIPRNMPSTLTENWRRHSSTVTSVMEAAGVANPALFTRASKCPNPASTWPLALVHDDSEVTSRTSGTAWLPRARMLSATSSLPAMSVMTATAPSRAIASDISRPRPPAPPVTSATLPARRPATVILIAALHSPVPGTRLWSRAEREHPRGAGRPGTSCLAGGACRLASDLCPHAYAVCTPLPRDWAGSESVPPASRQSTARRPRPALAVGP